MAIEVKVFLIVSACLVSVQDATFIVTKNDLKLELVQVSFRHGMRTPSQPEALYVNVTDPKIYGSQGFGQLTNEGKYQSYRFGQLLRNNYDEFLDNYVPERVYAYTSQWNRAKMTLQLVLAGLYPPLADEDKWHPTLQWRPIAYISAEHPCDILTTPHRCVKYNELHQYELDQSVVYKSQMAKFKDLFDYMDKVMGIPFETPLNAGWVFYAVVIHKLMKLPLPEWADNDQIMSQIRQVFKYNIDAMSLTKKLTRINGGTLVRRMIENIEENRNAKEPRKMYLYSNHDLSINSFEIAQGIEAFDIPPFGGAIILEKYHGGDKNTEYVRFLAWNGETDKFFPVRMNGCAEFCPYGNYRDLVKDMIPTDEELDHLVSGDHLYST